MKELIEEFISRMDQKEFEIHALKYDAAQTKQKSYAKDVLKHVVPIFDVLIHLTPNQILALRLMLDYYEADRDRTQASQSHHPRQFCVSQLLSNLEKGDR